MYLGCSRRHSPEQPNMNLPQGARWWAAIKNPSREFPLWHSGVRTQRCLCEDACSIHGLAQWVKDAAQRWCGYGCGVGHSGSFDLTPSLETSFFFVILGLHLWHMKVPRLGVQSELQLPAFATATATADLSACDLHHRARQRWILNPLSEARDQTRILMDTSQVCFR